MNSPPPPGLFVICGPDAPCGPACAPLPASVTCGPHGACGFSRAHFFVRDPTMLLEAAFSGVQILLRHANCIMKFVWEEIGYARTLPRPVLCNADGTSLWLALNGRLLL